MKKLNIYLGLAFETDEERTEMSDKLVALVDGLPDKVKEKAIIVKSDTETESVERIIDGTTVHILPKPDPDPEE